MKKLTSFAIALGAILLLAACGTTAKEETAVFKQEALAETTGIGNATVKITHKGEKISKIEADTTIPLDFGIKQEDIDSSIEELKNNDEIAQDEKDKLISEMEKMGNVEEQSTEMAKNMDDLYQKANAIEGVEVKTKQSKVTYQVTITVDMAKVDKHKLAEVMLPVDLSTIKDYKGAENALKTLGFKLEK
ncbi:hypothetical protein Hs30E_19320 [Lactococcus hodotermopsidis]|uniref:Lipoprotein n=1 Tax=Pseudolactococcus hodotermopsidis TaxID=2709157 RepID=A0A6A0BGI8_9LACT|nr:hypothetical protein [Lactococcus hodotermopsidis]GFH43381.1 hypothetical protein Hs30E_19320 [Lactococcus hodotermopsidis]